MFDREAQSFSENNLKHCLEERCKKQKGRRANFWSMYNVHYTLFAHSLYNCADIWAHPCWIITAALLREINGELKDCCIHTFLCQQFAVMKYACATTWNLHFVVIVTIWSHSTTTSKCWKQVTIPCMIILIGFVSYISFSCVVGLWTSLDKWIGSWEDLFDQFFLCVIGTFHQGRLIGCFVLV